MSLILSIDSSIPSGSVALLDSDRILSQKVFPEDLPSSKGLLEYIDQLLTDNRLELKEVDGFCITTGPGSFTGLRVGLSLLKGLALGTGKPFIGIDTLEALASQVAPCSSLICPLLDARKKEVYTAFFKYKGNNLVRQSADIATTPEKLADQILESTIFVGQGIEVYGDYLKKRLGSYFVHEFKTWKDSTAARAGVLAEKRFKAEKKLDLDMLQINYLRKSDAEIQSKQ